MFNPASPLYYAKFNFSFFSSPLSIPPQRYPRVAYVFTKLTSTEDETSLHELIIITSSRSSSSSVTKREKKEARKTTGINNISTETSKYLKSLTHHPRDTPDFPLAQTRFRLVGFRRPLFRLQQNQRLQL